MRAARRSILTLSLSALTCIVALSCGGSDSTGPGGGGNGVTITPDTASVVVGSTITLHAALTAGGGGTFFWSSENPSIASVSGSGVVTAVALGTVKIAASSGGKSGVATITVIPPGVASVRMNPASAVISVGGTVHLVAQPLDANGNVLGDRTVTWSSSNDAIATVDNTGLVTGVAVGADTITATSEGKTGIVGIAVSAAVPAGITVAPTSVSITTGQTSQLTATVKDGNGTVIAGAPVSWTVDHSNVAIVSSTGLVTGQTAGTATVTATSGSVHFDVPVTVGLPPANAVIVSPSSVSLLVTQRQQLTATVTDASGNTIPNQTITWSSDNTGVAAVGSTGLVIAVAPGTATITGTSGSVHGTAQVTVSLVPVRRVTVTPDVLSFTQGDNGTQLGVALLDSAGNALTGRAVSWSSNNNAVASVNGSGFVTPGQPGQAVITATAVGTGLSATATVTVTPVPVASVAVTPSLDTLVAGASVQLTATPKDASGNPLSGRAITWDGSDDNVAVVSSTGHVTATQNPGTMTVTATSEGKTGTSTIVVIAVPVASVTISPTTQSVVAGQSTPAFTAVTKDAGGHTLTGRTVTWSSSNTSVATIDPNTGVATGVTPGSTSITAQSEGVTSNTATLTVTDVPVATVTITPTTQAVDVGATTPAFTAVTTDAGGHTLTGRTVTWNSSNTGVATIDASGVATGVSAGTTTITASSEGKTSNGATLTVNPAPVGSVVVSPSSATVNQGDTPSFTATVQDAHGNTLNGRTVTWDSSNQGVATIDNNGNATTVGAGTTTITATSGGVPGTASLTVNPAPVGSVTVAPPFDTTNVGSTVQLTAQVTESNGPHPHPVMWKTSDHHIASVDPNGLVRGVAPGDAMITASSGAQSGSAQVTILPE